MENERARQGRKLLWKIKEQGKADTMENESKARQKVTMANESKARQKVTIEN